MITDELLCAISIAGIKGVGSHTIKRLVAHFGDCLSVHDASVRLLQQVPGVGSVTAELIAKGRSLRRADEEAKRMQKSHIRVLTEKDKSYPERLKHCHDSPFLLFYRGDLFAAPKVLSVIGTRNATDTGVEFTRSFLHALAEKYPDTLVVSGLAYGIDIAAHKAALTAGLKTYAVLGHGLDRIYPSMHRATAYDIIRQGALLSDFTTQSKMDRKNFISRNRIIAGLSDATIVVESASSGGALITADIAHSYDRDVFAVPGRPSDRWASGCNLLIKNQKAAVMESVDDLVVGMNWDQQTVSPVIKQQELQFDYVGDERLVLDTLIQNKQLPLDVLAAYTQIPLPRLAELLLSLEFSGVVKSLPGKIFMPLI